MAHLVRYELRREAPNAPPTWSQVWQEQQIHGKDMALAALSVPAALAGASTGTIFSLSSKKEGKVFSMQVGRAACRWGQLCSSQQRRTWHAQRQRHRCPACRALPCSLAPYVLCVKRIGTTVAPTHPSC